jgi:SnoaL-like domain
MSTSGHQGEAGGGDQVAKEAIREALYRYCRGEDRLDAQLSESLWHQDGTATYGLNGSIFDGPVSDWAKTSHAGLTNFLGSSHQMGNILIEVIGDRAVSESYVTARVWKRLEDDSMWQRITIGRYLDRWSCRDGIWAVDHRTFIVDLAYSPTSAPPDPKNDRPGQNDPKAYEAKRDRNDPSYDLFESL